MYESQSDPSIAAFFLPACFIPNDLPPSLSHSLICSICIAGMPQRKDPPLRLSSHPLPIPILSISDARYLLQSAEICRVSAGRYLRARKTCSLRKNHTALPKNIHGAWKKADKQAG
ncbi:uncharacterized protein MYCFIDRAFT_211106 [Pseudocercospora fijiensis CIRAD86]|uniref:Uncharacterized protein n=1 Tax=Pseudocercospora fijiensis (strain CIRAD86) TaxID=383855 RepID=M3AZM3_PSEFD|nr:uncharacterized protein MYCFIDRAFT_211106 [Pseudocercospora fijiensis CIRAD86]EME82618.1 hypothetical protein MYCFIDRAFT_211106 [Pseudocercospora fijiensis CIRAD86]